MKEIINEIEYNKQTIKAVTENDSLSEAEINSFVSQSVSNIFDLCVLLRQNGETDIAMKYLDDAEKYEKRLLEHRTGMTIRELNDFIITNNEYSDFDYELYWKIIREKAYEDFESFMFYLEKNRIFTKKFYEPRRYCKDGREGLKKVARELQKLKERKIKILSISMPSRVGKSTIFIMFLVWNAMRNPNSHSAYGGYSGILAKGFFKEILNITTSPEYTYEEIYTYFNPDKTFIQNKSMEDFTINFDTPDRFSTLTCRGIDGSWTGIIDISSDGILAVDDLIRDREHSMSQQRMDTTWQEFLNKMMDRMNSGSQMVLIGTLWSTLDPIMRLEKMYGEQADCLFLKIPALDENDESNFDYEYNGFPSQYYKDMRDRLDSPEWFAKFQQTPYVREGILFPVDNLKYFDGVVVESEIARVYAVTDAAVGGGDNVSVPICYEMKDGRRLICRWIYDKRTTGFTVPRVVSAIENNRISEMRIERNGVGALYLDNVKTFAKGKNVTGCKITGVSAPLRMNKDDKIKGYADDIIETFEFIDAKAKKPKDMPSGCLFFERDNDYRNAMEEMCMYTAEGKSDHDDAADSMAQLMIMVKGKRNGQIEVIHMPSGLSF